MGSFKVWGIWMAGCWDDWWEFSRELWLKKQVWNQNEWVSNPLQPLIYFVTLSFRLFNCKMRVKNNLSTCKINVKRKWNNRGKIIDTLSQ